MYLTCDFKKYKYSTVTVNFIIGYRTWLLYPVSPARMLRQCHLQPENRTIIPTKPKKITTIYLFKKVEKCDLVKRNKHKLKKKSD